MSDTGNHHIAEQLRRMADLLLQQGDRGFRPPAYRRAADAIDSLPAPLGEIYGRDGFKGLVALPAIGEDIAGAIVEILSTGRWSQFDRLAGELDPEETFQLIPGVGPQLAQRMHEGLGVDTLQQLEIAAHDGRLEQLPGVSRGRTAEIRAGLSDLLGGFRPVQAKMPHPPVEYLLDVDARYRKQATAGVLRMIAPKRFNPKNLPWLPVLHMDRKCWRFTALFSNTARAHNLNRTGDWVIIYAQSDIAPESQSTVVTATAGPLKGRRVVRGREAECIEHYEAVEAEA